MQMEPNYTLFVIIVGIIFGIFILYAIVTKDDGFVGTSLFEFTPKPKVKEELKTITIETIHCPICHNASITDDICGFCNFESKGYVIKQEVSKRTYQ